MEEKQSFYLIFPFPAHLLLFTEEMNSFVSLKLLTIVHVNPAQQNLLSTVSC